MVKRFPLMVIFSLLSIALFANENFKMTETRVISDNEQNLMAPKWSPDGRFIAAAGDQFGSIWLYDVETGKWQILVNENGAGWDFAWSPDSKKIAIRSNKFENRRKKTTIKYIDIITGKIIEVEKYDRDFSTPKWINNNELAYFHKNEYKTISTVQKEEKIAHENLKQQNICLFSAKGTYIKSANQKPELRKELMGQVFDVSFSPDGKDILFKKNGNEIYILDNENSNLKRVAQGEMPCWSPDGNFIVYSKLTDDGYQYTASDIFICDKSGETHTQITFTDAVEMRPDWSPDGNTIACDANGKIILISLGKE